MCRPGGGCVGSNVPAASCYALGAGLGAAYVGRAEAYWIQKPRDLGGLGRRGLGSIGLNPKHKPG